MIEVGKTAPAFSMTDQHGKTHRLSDYRGRWVILYFYPKDNTPGCTREACNFQATLRKLTARDAAVLGAKVDGVLLVLSAGKTRRDHAERARERLHQAKVRIVGATLTNAPHDNSLGYY